MQNFNFHQHTYRCGHSDQGMQDEEYVKEYLKMGFKKIAFTDHCPEKELIDTRDDMRMAYEDRIEYLDSIKALKEKYKGQLEILTGYEVEYLPGQEENLKELKDETDVLVLGQHFIYDTDGKTLKIIRNHKVIYNTRDMETYTDYIEMACKEGIPDIIAHPDLFMNAKNSFDSDCEIATRKICETSIKYNVPLEINLNNIFGNIFLNREDGTVKDLSLGEQYTLLSKVGYPNREFWKIASEYDIKVVYGLDVHYRNHIPLCDTLVNLATKIIGEETIKKLNFIEEM